MAAICEATGVAAVCAALVPQPAAAAQPMTAAATILIFIVIFFLTRAVTAPVAVIRAPMSSGALRGAAAGCHPGV